MLVSKSLSPDKEQQSACMLAYVGVQTGVWICLLTTYLFISTCSVCELCKSAHICKVTGSALAMSDITLLHQKVSLSCISASCYSMCVVPSTARFLWQL